MITRIIFFFKKNQSRIFSSNSSSRSQASSTDMLCSTEYIIFVNEKSSEFTVHQMIIDYTYRLQKRVRDDRTDELHPALLHVFAECLRDV